MTATGPATIVSRRPHGHRPSSRRPQARGMTATGPVIMEVDPGSVAGTAVDRFLDEPLPRGLNGETAVDRFLDEPSDRGPAGETTVDRSLDTGVGLKASAKKDEVSLPQRAAEQQAISLLIDLMSARESAKKNKAVGSDGCPSEFWKYLSQRVTFPPSPSSSSPSSLSSSPSSSYRPYVFKKHSTPIHCCPPISQQQACNGLWRRRWCSSGAAGRFCSCGICC